MNNKIHRALIVDDEVLAQNDLESIILEHGGFEIIGKDSPRVPTRYVIHVTLRIMLIIISMDVHISLKYEYCNTMEWYAVDPNFESSYLMVDAVVVHCIYTFHSRHAALWATGFF